MLDIYFEKCFDLLIDAVNTGIEWIGNNDFAEIRLLTIQSSEYPMR